MAFGWTATGFVAKRFTEIRDSLIARYTAETGTVVTLRRTPVLYMLFGVIAWELRDVWDAMQVVAADSLSPATAGGVHLDNLAAVRGFARLAEATSSAAVTITGGSSGQTIAAGATLEHDATGDAWRLPADVTLDGSGNGTATLESAEAGAFESESGETFSFTSPVLPSLTVTSSDDAEPGQLTETDAELRARMRLALYATGASTEPSMRAALLELTGMQSASIVSNRTDDEDDDGRPAHSFEATIYPGTVSDEDVALAIWQHQPAGIRSHGTESATVTDEAGVSQTVRWSVATELELYVEAIITTETGYEGDDEVRAVLSAWAARELGVGDDVRLHEIVAELADEIDGIASLEVRAKVGGAPGSGDTSNITVGATEIAKLPALGDGDYETRIIVTR